MSTRAHQRRIVSQFTAMAPAFATVPQFTDVESLDRLLTLTESSATDTALDVACGAGVVACHFAARVRRAVGVDITPAMLEQARGRQSRLSLTNVDWHCADVSALPYAASTFSVVTSRYAIHHMVDAAGVLREMKRVCAVDGRIAIADICLPEQTVDVDLFNRIERMNDPSHARALTETEWSRLSRASDLDLQPVLRYRLEFALGRMLARAGHSPSVVNGVEAEVQEAVGDGRLAGCARVLDGHCQFGYPITVFLGRVPSASR